MKIKFKIECTVNQLSELLKLLKMVAMKNGDKSLDDITVANWLYNAKELHELIMKKKIQHVNSDAKKKVSFKISLSQYVILGDSFYDLLLEFDESLYYETIFRTIIDEPCLKQFEQFKMALR